MDDSGEKGYYEIQMDNKQLAFVFVAAVALLVFIFLLGVHTGRGVRKADEESAAVSEPAQQAPAAQLAETKPTKDLEFFQEYSKSGSKQAGGEPSESAAPPSGAGSTQPPPSNPEATPPASAAKPEPTPAPAASEPPPQKVPTAATQPPPAGGDFVIQVLSTADAAKANALMSQLKSRGFPAFIQPVSTGAGTTYRVRVGPYPSRSDAEQKSAQLKGEAGVSDTWITPQ
jgi:DedD protein